MRRLISQFVDLPRPVQIALMAMTLGPIMLVAFIVRSMRGSKGFNWQLLGIVAIGICVVVVMLLAYRALRKHLKKRKAKPFESEIKASSSAVPQGVSDVADRAHLDSMRKRFEDGIVKFRDRGKDLYTVPWYVFIGESGSGKTEAIRHCGIKFPPGLQDELQGTGGTINMDWWFTDHGVILDTAGRMVFGDVESVDTKEWHEFLGLLQKHRKHCPINGLLLAIPIDSLIQDDATEIEQKAGKIAREMDQLQRMLGVRFPVYVLVTKADKLTGFRQFFSEFRDPQAQAQMLGWSNPMDLDDPFDPSSIKNSVDQITERLDRKRLALLQDPVNTEDQSARRTDQIDELYAFPEAVQRVASRLQRYLELIFTTGIWSSKPLFLRGIYFTSSMQHGQALDLELADALNVPIESLQEAAWTEDKAYFLRDVFQEKIFKEWGLVTGHTNIRRVQRRRRIALLGSGFAAAIIIACLTILYGVSYRSSIRDHVTFWENAAWTFEGGKNLPIVTAGEDGFFYIGRLNIARNADYWKKPPEGVSDDDWDREDRSNLLTILDLADERQREEIYTPWTFRPVALIQGEIGFDQRQDAFQHLLEEAIVRPLLVHSQNKFAKIDNWSDDETNALAHLIEIQEQGTISKRFVADQFQFLMGEITDASNDAPKLQAMLDRLYGGSEDDQDALPRDHPLRAGHTSAINTAIAELKDYWEQQQTGAVGRLGKYHQLLGAVEAFEGAEKHLLRLVPTKGTDVAKKQWNDRYAALSSTTAGRQRKSLIDLKVDLDHAIVACEFNAGADATEQNVITLEQALRDAERALLGDAKRTFDMLLAAATGQNDANIDDDATDREGIAGDLVRFWQEFKIGRDTPLRSGDHKVKHADELYLGPIRDPTWREGEYKRLYQLRFAMYETVHVLFGNQQNESVTFGDTADRFENVKDAIEKATRKIGEFTSQMPGDSADPELKKLFGDATGLCNAVADATTRQHLYGIVVGDFQDDVIGEIRSGIELASKIKNLAGNEDGAEDQLAKYELPAVPLTALKLDRRYYPPLAMALFADWAAMSQADSDFESDALKTYAEDYYEYWSEGIFRDLLTLKSRRWADLVADLQIYDEVEITQRLIDLGTEITKRLTEFEATMRTVRVQPTFPKSIAEVIEQIQDAGTKANDRRDKYTKILSNWQALKSDPSRARKSVLPTLETQRFVGDYSLSHRPQGTNAVQFVHRFWLQFSIDALELLVEAVREGTRKVLVELLELRRFPIAGDGARQLPHDDVIRAQQLVGDILAEASPSDAPTSSDSSPGSLAARISLALKNLSSPLVGKDRKRFEKWYNLLAALPGKDKTYEAEIFVSPGKGRASDIWQYMDCVTDRRAGRSGRMNIAGSANGDKSLRQVQYPDSENLYLRFYKDVDAQPDPDVVMVDSDGIERELSFKGPWAILHLLHALNGKLESTNNEAIWRAELKVKRKGPNQQYSVWLSVQFKDVDPPPLQDWPNEIPVPAENAR